MGRGRPSRPFEVKCLIVGFTKHVFCLCNRRGWLKVAQRFRTENCKNSIIGVELKGREIVGISRV